MSRFAAMMGGLSGQKKSTGGRSGIGSFAQKNPNFMKMDASKRSELLTQMTMDMQRAEASTRKATSNFHLPGTQAQTKELSATAKKMIEQMLEKQLKKRQKEVVTIRACWFGNGTITKDGKILDAAGKQVGKIDKDSMKITMGNSILGKYKDDSFTLHKLTRKMDALKAAAAPKDTASNGLWGMGNFYGTAEPAATSWW